MNPEQPRSQRDRAALLGALRLIPGEGSSVTAAEGATASAPAFQSRHVEVSGGSVVSAFTGRNAGPRPEQATFQGGALFCLAFSGLRASRIGRRQYDLPARESCTALLSPGPVEVASIATSETTRTVIAAYFAPESLDHFGIDPLRHAPGGDTRLQACPLTPVARGLAQELFRPGVSAITLRLRAEALVLELLAGLEEQRRASATAVATRGLSGPGLAAVHRARDIIAADPAADHTLGSIAAAAGLSVSTLKRRFQQVFDTSPIAYLRERRLELGRELIERDGLPVSSAAYACGYGHPGNFAQAFRRKYGHPPSAGRA